MKLPGCFLFLCFCLLSRADELEWLHAPPAAFGPAAPDSPDYRKYAPDRQIDILHLTLDVTPDFRQRTVSGTAAWKFKPIAKPLVELKLDGVDLNVASVTSTEQVASYQVTEDKVIITFAEAIPAGKEASVTVRYSAQPEKGLYFRTPELGYKPEDMHIWTQGEADEARHWYPCYDYPNEKFTVEMICHVPDGIVVLANGRKVSEEKDANGLQAVRWLQDKPMVNYLVCLVAGKLKSIEDKHGDLSMKFWTPTSEIEHAANSFDGTKDMMEFFEKEIGVPYPWDKYDQVCIQDYHWGGMENTSLTTLNINTLFPKTYENIRSSQGLVAHELAHQWFGDLVTCKDWSHIWLNEGFASYYDALYTEHKQGRDEFLYRMHEGRKSLTGSTNSVKSMVWRKYGDPVEQFDNLAYGKGSWVLHMLRTQLGPDLFRECVKAYVERHKYGSVVTDDLRNVLEELTGRSFDQFFDQWVYHAGSPLLNIDYSWDAQTKLAKISVQQSQPVNENMVLFKFPLPVRFVSKSGTTERVLEVREKSEDFYVPLTEQPQLVRIDPNVSVLARINFRVPNAMQAVMLANQKDAVGQLIACEQMGERKDHEAVMKLKEALNSDAQWFVRIAAARALRGIHNDESFDALVASMKQSDARIRRQVVVDVTSFYRPAAFEQAQNVLKTEKNPDIVAAALSALTPIGTNARPTLVQFLNSDSWRQQHAETAMAAMRAQNDPFYIDPMRDTLQRRKAEFMARTINIALDALAYLSREQESKDTVRELIASYINDPRRSVQLAAVGALGTLRDERALPILERFASLPKTSPQRTTAERAIESIRAARKTTLEVGDVRREVIELQKQNRELRKDFDALKKKLDSMVAPKTGKK
ncbi:MAG TPA: M1 family aminopeptidase [Methylomirabilota bacterium]|nr:M1 family aminopeptidase [Methylomirabilota bacterium]